MTTNEFFSLLLKMRRNERVYICTTTDDDVVPTNWHNSYSRNDLFVNLFGDIITMNGTYVGNLRDCDKIINVEYTGKSSK